jgi:signal transduction histidine kinase
MLMIPWLNEKGNVLHGIILYVIFLFFFYVLKNLQIEIFFLTRPQIYTILTLKKKLFSQLNGAVISLIYGVILYILGSQNRGQIDVFSYFFFFSPLIGLSLLSTFFVRLKKEKNRLKALFSITTDLNKMLPVKEWLSNLRHYFHDFIEVEATALWIKEDGTWNRKYVEGRFNKDLNDFGEDLSYFNEIKHPILYKYDESKRGIIEKYFDEDIRSYIYAPLVVEAETVGMFIIGRNKINSFTEEDVSSIATLANQIAVSIKTRMLIQEQENQLIIEERNRIARDLHDGIAQTLAGSVLKLETAQRKLEVKPEEAMHLMTDIIQRLRFSLKEVRESIYAMRPYPTNSVGLISAIKNKIQAVQREYDHKIEFEIRGKEINLSSMVEKILFDTFQESLTNSLKHANATKIDVLLSYQSNHILLKVKDNGNGFSLFHAMIKARNHPHFGILNMNEAAESICASLLIDSKEKGGTEVILTVPRMGLEGSEVS